MNVAPSISTPDVVGEFFVTWEDHEFCWITSFPPIPVHVILF